MIMEDIFIKNLAIMTPKEQALLSQKRVFVAGCGGLGGSVIEILCRTGFSHITAADDDIFEESNMNRQILCTCGTLGASKSETAAERARLINPAIDFTPVRTLITPENVRSLIHGCDLVIDALDSIMARLVLEDACAVENIPLIHGAVSGWQLQTAVCMPGSQVLHRLYANSSDRKSQGGTAMTVFACASFEVSEGVKLLLDRPDVLRDRVLLFDLIDKESTVLDFSQPFS